MSLRIYGNRPLKTLSGQQTRPTPARVREAVFNIWQNSITGCHWLDLCAGSGSMGAEALCRGASRTIAIEQSGPACRIIRQNWQQVASPNQTFEVIRGDVSGRLKSLAGQQFHRIYFDPPYASDLYQPVIEAIANYQLLTSDGELAVEHDPKRWTVQPFSGLQICREKVYGNTALTFYCISEV
ncbi:RNA methyltransferase, RsmD family [Lyngbya aestuarii BL J]|uniref:RNA methyltransferase, RsmD family n=1 Tax=Lyngbya aestuarii BL J TaxID=1348334 RepID=U7QIG9_9CYAN|nr:16S rRNA (guanine(966)-N(2))-methyltransferase RsmD [Lyngbya aestuarii]ERT06221.1 RNA methyltransferase, RsmD family [Lyngbya aestuarii BL J]